MIKLGSTQNARGEVGDHKGKTELVQIFISYGDAYINFLQFVYLENGSLILSDRLSGTDQGSKFNTVKLNYPDEFLTSITGSYGSTYKNLGSYRITSITFGTNRGSYGPFGKPQQYNSQFDFQMGQDRSFAGFHGTTKDGVLESIGVYIKPVAILSNLKSAAKIMVKPEM